MTIEKILKVLDKDVVAEMEALDSKGLEASIVASEGAMRQVQLELDANEQYQEIKEQKKAMEAGKREVNKHQRARIAYALMLLEERGQ